MYIFYYTLGHECHWGKLVFIVRLFIRFGWWKYINCFVLCKCLWDFILISSVALGHKIYWMTPKCYRQNVNHHYTCTKTVHVTWCPTSATPLTRNSAASIRKYLRRKTSQEIVYIFGTKEPHVFPLFRKMHIVRFWMKHLQLLEMWWPLQHAYSWNSPKSCFSSRFSHFLNATKSTLCFCSVICYKRWINRIENAAMVYNTWMVWISVILLQFRFLSRNPYLIVNYRLTFAIIPWLENVMQLQSVILQSLLLFHSKINATFSEWTHLTR